jgi:hypothetical protein
LLEDKVDETKENAQKVANYCKDWVKLGYESESACTNLIYQRCINKIPEFKYRPVNLYNPFPYAALNAEIAPEYEAGTRPIGSNWRGYENQITSTDTSNKSVYYQFVLEPGDIADIKSEIEKSGTKKFVYTQLNRIDGTGENDPYKSVYIRDDNHFHRLFCYIQGIKVGDKC